MPVTEETSVTITCDNPACPGNDLDPADRTGWLFVTHEVYGQTSNQNVYSSAACLSVVSGTATPSEAGAW